MEAKLGSRGATELRYPLSALIQNLLAGSLQTTHLSLPVSSAVQLLPLKELQWASFEQLCVRLALKDHEFKDARGFGTTGQNQQGIDLYAVNDAGEYSVWQCKRYQRFHPPLIESAVEEFLKGHWAKSAKEFRLCVTDDLTSTGHAYAIEKARNMLLNNGIRFIPMGLREFSYALKEHPDLVADFFGPIWREHFCVKTASWDSRQDGQKGQADSVDEVLISNLMKVIAFPDTVWSAPTDKRKHREIFEIVQNPDALLLKDKHLFTFANLDDQQCPLRTVVDSNHINRLTTESWFEDTIRVNWLIELMNSCLKQYLFSLGLKWNNGHRYFFKPSIDGGNRFLGEGKRALKLAYEVNGFWVHRSATLAFKRLGKQFFLLIEPGFMFTKDGRKVLGGTDTNRKAMQWGGRQQNDDILRSILFWTRFLAGNEREARIHAGADTVVLKVLPATSHMSWGIAHDHVHVSSLMESVDLEMEHLGEMVQNNGSDFDTSDELDISEYDDDACEDE